MLRGLIIFVLVSSLIPMNIAVSQTAPDRAAVNFSFGEGVTAADEYLIQEGIRLAQDYFIEIFGSDVQEAVAVNVIYDPETSMNVGRDYTVSINTATYVGFPPIMRLRLVVHEYFHVWQEDMSGEKFSGQNPLGPQWLIEGGADYIAFDALIWAGLVSPEKAREYTVLKANGAMSNQLPILPPLEDLRTWRDMLDPAYACCAYEFSTIAVEALVGEAGAARFGDYFQELGASWTLWQTVFQDIFGMRVNEFYDGFEVSQPTLLSPSGADVSQLMQTPYSNEAPAFVEVGAFPETVTPGEQALLLGWTSNGTACTMTVLGTEGAELTSLPTYADAYGLVVFLWSVPETLDVDAVTVQVSCGANPAVLAINIG